MRIRNERMEKIYAIKLIRLAVLKENGLWSMSLCIFHLKCRLSKKLTATHVPKTQKKGIKMKEKTTTLRILRFMLHNPGHFQAYAY